MKMINKKSSHLKRFKRFFGNYKPPKKLKVVRRKNVMDKDPFTIDPRYFFNNGLKKSIDLLRRKGDNILTISMSRKGWLNKLATIAETPLYITEKILSVVTRKSLIDSDLYEEDVNKNTDCIPSSDRKDKATKDGIIPRNYRRLARWLLNVNNISQNCDCCNSSTCLPNLVFFRSLGEMVREAKSIGRESVPGCVFVHLKNIFKLCPNCHAMWKIYHGKAFADGTLDELTTKRVKSWEVEYDINSKIPYAQTEEAKIGGKIQIIIFGKRIYFNVKNPGKSRVEDINRTLEEWTK